MDQNQFLFTLISHLASLISFSVIFIFFLLTRSSTTASGATVDSHYLDCVNKTCGDGQNINFPFYIKDQQKSFCGFPGFELSCNKAGNPIMRLPHSGNQYIIHHIFYNNQTLRVSNSAFWDTKSSISGSGGNHCDVVSSFKNLSFPIDHQFELVGDHKTQVSVLYNCSSGGDNRTLSERLVSKKVDGCWNGDHDSVVAMDEDDPDLGLAKEECTKLMVAPVEGYGGKSTAMITRLRGGFVMKWTASNCSVCEQSGGKCGFDNSTFHFKCFCPDRPHAWNCTGRPGSGRSRSTIKVAVAATASGVGILIIILVLCFKKKNSSNNSMAFWRKKTKNFQNIEAFFRNYGSLAPKRYSYSQIKKMTNSFKVKLGQGGYGGVYKGMLHDGRDVAVKVLNESKEVCCREFGEVSHKSDVYSYGMMVLEMAGGRKNVDVGVSRTTEIYFPHWVYERLEVDEELGLHGIENEEDKESARKMIIVSLWCIQTNPSSRPAMNRVVEMLEGSLDSLPIPPKPFLSSSRSQPQAPDSSASASLIC
ncbi:hypothetical protein LWI28_022832 [Acer negundo]|uniref:non-specific serine/threonine protein kinase n=1 Tax=Acer negundo TaxID=4023 RepID=A0AAD5NNX3_ACENE|nr:hypothetical protein LWI28_022832 [Acer negundo]